MKRQGLGKGLGKGYKNIAPMDSHIHSLSAKGVKQNYKRMLINVANNDKIKGLTIGNRDMMLNLAKDLDAKGWKRKDISNIVKTKHSVLYVSETYPSKIISIDPSVKKGGGWYVHITNKKPKNFKTKKEAMAYAKKYMSSHKELTKEQKLRRGLGTVAGLVAGAEATKGTRYEGVGALVGGYAGYKLAEGFDAKGNKLNKKTKERYLGSLRYQYGNKARELSMKLFNKPMHELNTEQEFDLLFDNLRKTGDLR